MGREAFAAAAQRSRLSGVKPGETPSGSALLGAVGGIRGLIETILPVSARLIANKAHYKFKGAEIDALRQGLEQAVQA